MLLVPKASLCQETAGEKTNTGPNNGKQTPEHTGQGAWDDISKSRNNDVQILLIKSHPKFMLHHTGDYFGDMTHLHPQLKTLRNL